MSAPRPFETDPFHPLRSIYNIKQVVYICNNLRVISSIWEAQVCIFDNYACALAETLKFKKVQSHFLSYNFFPRVHAAVY